MEQNLPASRAHRRSPNQAVATAGGVAAVCLAGLADMTYEVHQQALTAPNTQALLEIHHDAPHALVHLSAVLAKVGAPMISIVLGLVIAALLFVSRKRLDAWSLAGVIILSAGTDRLLKSITHNPRPHLFHWVVAAHGYSFPSGHSTLAFALWGFLAVWVIGRRPRDAWRWLVGLIFLGYAALVAFSRLVLGVHWPTDVIAGALLAGFWIALVHALKNWARARFAK